MAKPDVEWILCGAVVNRHVQIIEKMDEAFVENISARVAKEGLTDIEKDIDNMRIIEYEITKEEAPVSETSGTPTETDAEGEPEEKAPEEVTVDKKPINVSEMKHNSRILTKVL